MRLGAKAVAAQMLLPWLLLTAASLGGTHCGTAADAPGPAAAAPAAGQGPAAAAPSAVGIVGVSSVQSQPSKAQVERIVNSVSTDALAAHAFLDELALVDADGDSAYLYILQRFYGIDNVVRWKDILRAQTAGMYGAITALDLRYKPRYIVWHNTSGNSNATAATADLDPALKPYISVDVFFTIGSIGSTPRTTPIPADFLTVLQAYMRQTFFQSNLNKNNETGVILAIDYAKGWNNAQRLFFDQLIVLNLTMFSNSPPERFTIEAQTLMVKMLRDLVYKANTPAKAVNMTLRSVEAVPAPVAARKLLQPQQATVTKIDVSLRCRMIEVDQIIPTRLVQQAFQADNRLALYSYSQGLNLTNIQLTDSRITTVMVRPDGTTESRMSANSVSGYPVPFQVPTAAGASRPGLNISGVSSADAPAPGLAATADNRDDKRLGAGAIAGIVIAAVAATAAALLIMAGLPLLIKARKRRQEAVQSRLDSPSTSADSLAKHPFVQLQPDDGPNGRLQRVIESGNSGLDSNAIEALLRAQSTNQAGLAEELAAAAVMAAHRQQAGDLATSADDAEGTDGANPRSDPNGDRGGATLTLDDRIGSSTLASRSLSATQQEIAPEDLQICRRPDGSLWCLGKGSYGQVYKAMRWGMQPCAVKKWDVAFSAESWLTLLLREIRILQAVSFDRNIVQFYGACLADPEHPLLVMEYMEGGDLRHALNLDSTGEFDWRQRGRGIALDIARGLQFLHSAGAVHRDLKSSNVLLTADGVAKLGDVGLAQLRDANESSFAAVGTFSHAAPELLLGLKCDAKADIYSLGVVLWELCSKEIPRRGQLRDLRIPDEGPPGLPHLIDDCMAVDPAQRPTAQQVFQRILETLGDLEAEDNAASSSLSTRTALALPQLPAAQRAATAEAARQQLRGSNHQHLVHALGVAEQRRK